MAFCSNCGAELPEGAASCPGCGAVLKAANAFDHTADFDAKDISDNKAFALFVYAFEILGLVVGAILAKDSEYLKFHLRAAIKIEVVAMVAALASVVLFWTIIVPIAAAVLIIILFVIKVIAFVQVCQGKAVEPWLIRSIGALQ